MATSYLTPSTVETTLGLTFAIVPLPFVLRGEQREYIRKPPVYTLTAGAFDSASTDTLSLTLTEVDGVAPETGTTVYVDARTVLNFGTGKVLEIAAGTDIGTTATDITVITPETAVTLTGTETAETEAFIYVIGCNNASISPQIQNEDVTTYLSGAGKEMQTVSRAGQLQIEFRMVIGDRGGTVFRNMMFDPADRGREFAFKLSFPSGEKHEGIAILNDASPQGGVQQIRSVSGSAQIQGEHWIYTKPTTV